MNLRDKYNHAIQVAKGFRMEGSAQERDGKLYFNGMVKNQDEVNKIWDAIKTVPDWRNDIVAEVTDRSERASREGTARPTPSRPATRSARSPRSISAMPTPT